MLNLDFGQSNAAKVGSLALGMLVSTSSEGSAKNGVQLVDLLVKDVFHQDPTQTVNILNHVVDYGRVAIRLIFTPESPRCTCI